MGALGNYLLTQLDSKYTGITCWDTFRDNLKSGADLETALLGITLTPEMLTDVKCETWNLISSKDLALFDHILFNNKLLSLARLIKKYYQTHLQKIDIITKKLWSSHWVCLWLSWYPCFNRLRGMLPKKVYGHIPVEKYCQPFKSPWISGRISRCAWRSGFHTHVEGASPRADPWNHHTRPL